jgi:phosphoglycerate dehydrogenase-like enzyme
MSKKILVTDSLFIFDEHVKKLEAEGFEVERLDKLIASKGEMTKALENKVGYICGGLEKTGADVIETAKNLKAISVLASGYTEFLPGYEQATKQGIAIAACPGANTQAVAEYTLLLILASIRNLKGLTTLGGATFHTGRELPSLTLGLIGFGHIGQAVAKLAMALGMKVLITSRHSVSVLGGVKQVDLAELLKSSDVVSLHVNKIHGKGIIGKQELAMMKTDAILISTIFTEAIDHVALRGELLSGRLKYAADTPLQFEADGLSKDSFICSNESNAFNTKETLQRMSDRATNSMINLLKTGDDSDLVNPEYKDKLKQS